MKKAIPVIFFSLVLITGLTLAQDLSKLPPQEVIDIVTTPSPPRISISPDGGWYDKYVKNKHKK